MLLLYGRPLDKNHKQLWLFRFFLFRSAFANERMRFKMLSVVAKSFLYNAAILSFRAIFAAKEVNKLIRELEMKLPRTPPSLSPFGSKCFGEGSKRQEKQRLKEKTTNKKIFYNNYLCMSGHPEDRGITQIVCRKIFCKIEVGIQLKTSIQNKHLLSKKSQLHLY